MELDRLLKFFEAKINTTLNEDDVFLKKYQTKQNSVFTDKDFEALKKDLTCYAGIDFNTKDISMPELIQLYNSKVDKKDRQYSVTDFSRFIDLAITLKENPEIIEEAEQSAYSDEISGQTENLDLEPTAEEQAVAKRYSTVFGELGDSLDIFQLRAITSMGENARERFDEIVSVLPAAILDKAKMSGMYDVYSLVNLASSDLNDEQFKSVREFIEKGMKPAYASAIMRMMPDRAESVKNLISILTKEQSSEEAQKIVYQFSDELGSLFSGDDDMYERVLRFACECKDMVTPDNLWSMRIICEKTSGKRFDRALELIKSSEKENIENFQILSISALDSEKYEQAKSLYLNPEYDGLDIVELLNVNEDMREKIKDYLKSNGIKMDPWNFREFCKLSEEEFNNFQKLSDFKFDGKALNTDFRIKLAKCKKEDIEKVKDIKTEGTGITQKVLVYMAQAGDDRLITFVKNHPDYYYEVKDLKECLNIRTSEEGDTIIRHNKTGKSFDIVKNEVETHRSEKTVVNNDFKRRQEIEYTRIPDLSGRKDFVTGQKIESYDSEGNLIKTETYASGDIPGVANITEILADGTKKILQQSTKDKNGTVMVMKDFESPDGTRTQVQNIEDAIGNRRSLYKITDKDGNVLLNQTRTFKVLGENKFQSSLNGYSYEIEYTDGLVKITDMQSGKVSEINMTDSISSENKDSILNVLKKIDASQLLVMNLNNIDQFTYGKDIIFPEFLNNAYWSEEKKEIYLGETTFTDSQEAFISRNFSTLCHELGHFIDSTSSDGESSAISSQKNIEKIFQKEYDQFLKMATTEEEGFVEYFTGSMQGEFRAAEERVAETNMLLHSNPNEQIATRAYYFQRYFPRTIAAISQEISKIEQKAAGS